MTQPVRYAGTYIRTLSNLNLFVDGGGREQVALSIDFWQRRRFG